MDHEEARRIHDHAVRLTGLDDIHRHRRRRPGHRSRIPGGGLGDRAPDRLFVLLPDEGDGLDLRRLPRAPRIRPS
jgi:hypothetical protein